MIFLLLFEKVNVCAYPISSFVSYDHLSPSSCSFVASLDRVSILKIIQEALSHPG